MSATSNDSVTQPQDPLINLPQILGSAVAAASATAAASYFGITGTVIGAVAASIVATVVSATSTHSLRRSPKVALTSVGVLAMVMLAVTGVEGIAGRPLSALIGNDQAAVGTTFGRTVSGEGTSRTTVKGDVPRKSPAQQPDATTVPAPTPTPAPRPTPTDTGAPQPTTGEQPIEAGDTPQPGTEIPATPGP